jgi:hypothetical protein
MIKKYVADTHIYTVFIGSAKALYLRYFILFNLSKSLI